MVAALLAPVQLGDPDWIYPSFINGWVNYTGDPTWTPTRYRKMGDGLVLIEMMIQGGTIGQPAFILPVGYRPTKKIMPAASTYSNAFGRCDILPDGGVYPMSGANNWWSLVTSFYGSQ